MDGLLPRSGFAVSAVPVDIPPYDAAQDVHLTDFIRRRTERHPPAQTQRRRCTRRETPGMPLLGQESGHSRSSATPPSLDSWPPRGSSLPSPRGHHPRHPDHTPTRGPLAEVTATARLGPELCVTGAGWLDIRTGRLQDWRVLRAGCGGGQPSSPSFHPAFPAISFLESPMSVPEPLPPTEPPFAGLAPPLLPRPPQSAVPRKGPSQAPPCPRPPALSPAALALGAGRRPSLPGAVPRPGLAVPESPAQPVAPLTQRGIDPFTAGLVAAQIATNPAVARQLLAGNIDAAAWGAQAAFVAQLSAALAAAQPGPGPRLQSPPASPPAPAWGCLPPPARRARAPRGSPAMAPRPPPERPPRGTEAPPPRIAAGPRSSGNRGMVARLQHTLTETRREPLTAHSPTGTDSPPQAWSVAGSRGEDGAIGLDDLLGMDPFESSGTSLPSRPATDGEQPQGGAPHKGPRGGEPPLAAPSCTIVIDLPPDRPTAAGPPAPTLATTGEVATSSAATHATDLLGPPAGPPDWEEPESVTTEDGSPQLPDDPPLQPMPPQPAPPPPPPETPRHMSREISAFVDTDLDFALAELGYPPSPCGPGRRGTPVPPGILAHPPWRTAASEPPEDRLRSRAPAPISVQSPHLGPRQDSPAPPPAAVSPVAPEEAPDPPPPARQPRVSFDTEVMVEDSAAPLPLRWQSSAPRHVKDPNASQVRVNFQQRAAKEGSQLEHVRYQSWPSRAPPRPVPRVFPLVHHESLSPKGSRAAAAAAAAPASTPALALPPAIAAICGPGAQIKVAGMRLSRPVAGDGDLRLRMVFGQKGCLSHPPLATAPRPTWAEEFTITLQGHTAGALRWELHRGADPATLAFAEMPLTELVPGAALQVERPLTWMADAPAEPVALECVVACLNVGDPHTPRLIRRPPWPAGETAEVEDQSAAATPTIPSTVVSDQQAPPREAALPGGGPSPGPAAEHRGSVDSVGRAPHSLSGAYARDKTLWKMDSQPPDAGTPPTPPRRQSSSASLHQPPGKGPPLHTHPIAGPSCGEPRP